MAREEGEGQEAKTLKHQVSEEEARSKHFRTEVAIKEREIACLTEEMQILRDASEKKAIESDRLSIELKRLQIIIS